MGETATARVVVEISAVDARSGKPAVIFGKMNRAFGFVNDKGIWRVWCEVAAEEELAAALVAAATDEERDRHPFYWAGFSVIADGN